MYLFYFIFWYWFMSNCVTAAHFIGLNHPFPFPASINSPRLCSNRHWLFLCVCLSLGLSFFPQRLQIFLKSFELSQLVHVICLVFENVSIYLFKNWHYRAPNHCSIFNNTQINPIWTESDGLLAGKSLGVIWLVNGLLRLFL